MKKYENNNNNKQTELVTTDREDTDNLGGGVKYIHQLLELVLNQYVRSKSKQSKTK